MKWTNRHNLPQPVVDLVVNDPYNKGDSDISITGLQKPPRMRVLEKLHADEIVQDVSDRLGSFLGRLMHQLLENANTSGLAEERFFTEIEGVRISGQLDVVDDNGCISDYKLIPLRKIDRGTVPEEFEQQLNMYAELLRRNGKVVKKLQIVAFFKDWFQAGVRSAALKGWYYPPSQCMTYEVPLWSSEKATAFITERVLAHKAANLKLPRCTAEERWAEPDKYAVIKPGATRSLKNHDTREMAEQHSVTTPGTIVEVRPGSSKRCEGWCPVKEFCTQYKKEIQTKENQ